MDPPAEPGRDARQNAHVCSPDLSKSTDLLDAEADSEVAVGAAQVVHEGDAGTALSWVAQAGS